MQVWVDERKAERLWKEGRNEREREWVGARPLLPAVCVRRRKKGGSGALSLCSLVSCKHVGFLFGLKSRTAAPHPWLAPPSSIHPHLSPGPSHLSLDPARPHSVPGLMPASPPGNVFPTLVVVGHIVTLIAVWQWRQRRRQLREGWRSGHACHNPHRTKLSRSFQGNAINYLCETLDSQLPTKQHLKFIKMKREYAK